MRDQPQAVRRRRPAGLAAALILVAGLTAACTGSTDEPTDAGSASPTPTSTPLADLDLTGVTLPRTPSFCEALDPSAVSGVLGGEAETTVAYRSGQRTEVVTGLRDVANEYSCYFERGQGAAERTARTWLFAQAVSPSEARQWVEERQSDEGCRSAGELAFGEPGLVQSCSSGTRRRVTAVGLFGDGWLTCQTTAPAAVDEAELLEEAQRWCADVVQSAAAS